MGCEWNGGGGGADTRVLNVKNSGYQGEKRKWVTSKKRPLEEEETPKNGVFGGLFWGFVLGHGRKEHVLMQLGSLP